MNIVHIGANHYLVLLFILFSIAHLEICANIYFHFTLFDIFFSTLFSILGAAFKILYWWNAIFNHNGHIICLSWGSDSQTVNFPVSVLMKQSICCQWYCTEGAMSKLFKLVTFDQAWKTFLNMFSFFITSSFRTATFQTA